jgi:hypothetical protein
MLDDINRMTHHLRSPVRLAFGVLAFLCVFVLLFGVPHYYAVDPLEVTVVDSVSGRPIQGAIVVAYWRLTSPGCHSDHFSDVLEVQEVTTDSIGVATLKGFRSPTLFTDELHDAPFLIVFKPTYDLGYTAGGYATGFLDMHQIGWARGASVALSAQSNQLPQDTNPLYRLDELLPRCRAPLLMTALLSDRTISSRIPSLEESRRRCAGDHVVQQADPGQAPASRVPP